MSSCVHDHFPARAIALLLGCLPLASMACGDDALVGREPAAEGMENGTKVGDQSCERELPAIPDGDLRFAESPLLLVESARGTWGNAAGDVLTVTIEDHAVEVDLACLEAQQRGAGDPGPSRTAGPSLSLRLRAQVTFERADGSFAERFELPLVLTPSSSEPPFETGALGGLLSSLGGYAGLALAELRGTFAPPAELAGAVDLLRFHARFERTGWIVKLAIPPLPEDGGCGCGDRADAWSSMPIAFVRR